MILRFDGHCERAEFVGDVFAFFADPRALPSWDPGVRGVVALDGEPGVGSRFVVDAGLSDPLTYEIVEWTPPILMEWTAENGATRATDRFEFSATTGGGTLLRMRSTLELADESARVNALRERAFRAAAAAALASAEGVALKQPE